MSALRKIVTAFPDKKIGFFDFGGRMGDPNINRLEYFNMASNDYQAAAKLISDKGFKVVAVHGLTIHESEFLEELSGIAPLILP